MASVKRLQSTRYRVRSLALFQQRIELAFQRISPREPIGPWSRTGLWILLVLVLAFFVITLNRQAFSDTRKGDLGVYFRAGWAARSGSDIYEVTDNHGWHYLYPPFLASLMIPLADPPDDAPTHERLNVLPFWVSASIWYWLNVLSVFASLHIVASALEQSRAASGVPPPPPFSQAWWALRIWPLLLTLFPVGDALGRGQSTALLLLLLSATTAATLQGRNTTAGVCLGLAGVIKVFPIYLVQIGRAHV